MKDYGKWKKQLRKNVRFYLTTSKLIKGATQLLKDVLGKNPQTTVVVIDEVETDNWGIGGETVTVRRKQGQ